jgi:hypothetical protein
VNLLRPVQRVIALIRGTIARTIELREIFVFGGLAAVGYGIAQIHAPSAWIIIGATFFLLGMRR